MAEHVNNNLWGPLREAVEQAGERAKELNGQARKLAVAAVQDARKLAVAAAQDARTRAFNGFRDGEGFAGEHGFIDGGRAGFKRTINRNPLGGLD